MTYSTGSGDYNALMAAVLTHALSDGWTEDGGLGTGYPIISPGGNSAFDWTSYTASENDVTVGGGGTKTQRYLRLGIGTTGANATSNAATTTTIVPNMAYTFTAWHIFSDTSVSDHIHVVVEFSNGPNTEIFTSFSFGELDKGGLTYQGITYATAHPLRGYAATTESGASNSRDWNFGQARTQWGWTGFVGEAGFDVRANLSFLTQSTSAPHPNNSGGWPAWDTVIEDGDNVWAKMGLGSSSEPGNTFDPAVVSGDFLNIQGDVLGSTAPAATGLVSMMPMPFLLINSTGAGGVLRYVGTFPNVRLTNVKDVEPGAEVTYSGDTWMIFPLLKKTSWANTNQLGIVSSGYAGLAFKKVT